MLEDDRGLWLAGDRRWHRRAIGTTGEEGVETGRWSLGVLPMAASTLFFLVNALVLCAYSGSEFRIYDHFVPRILLPLIGVALVILAGISHIRWMRRGVRRRLTLLVPSFATIAFAISYPIFMRN